MGREARRPWGIDQRHLPGFKDLESAKLGTVPYCELASRLVVPRQREADGKSSSMTDAQSCVFIMYRWSGSLTSKPPGVARMFRCSAFDALRILERSSRRIDGWRMSIFIAFLN